MVEVDLSRWIQDLSNILEADNDTRAQAESEIYDVLLQNPSAAITFCAETIGKEDLQSSIKFQAFNFINVYFRKQQYSNFTKFRLLDQKIKDIILEVGLFGLLFINDSPIQQTASIVLANYSLNLGHVELQNEIMNRIFSTYEENSNDLPGLIVAISYAIQQIIIFCNLVRSKNKIEIPNQILQECLSYISNESSEEYNVLQIVNSMRILIQYCDKEVASIEYIQNIGHIYNNLFRYQSVEIIISCCENLFELFRIIYDGIENFYFSFISFIEECFKVDECYYHALKLLHSMVLIEVNERREFSISQVIFETFFSKFEEILNSITNIEEDTFSEETPMNIVTDILSSMYNINSEVISNYIQTKFEEGINSGNYSLCYGSIYILYSLINHPHIEVFDFIYYCIIKISQNQVILTHIGTLIASYDLIAAIIDKLYGIFNRHEDFPEIIFNFIQICLDMDSRVIKSAAVVSMNLVELLYHSSYRIDFQKLQNFYISLLSNPEVFGPVLCSNYFESLGSFLYHTENKELSIEMQKLITENINERMNILETAQYENEDIEFHKFVINSLLVCLDKSVRRYIGPNKENPNRDLYEYQIKTAVRALNHNSDSFMVVAIKFLSKLSLINMNGDHIILILGHIVPGLSEGDKTNFDYSVTIITSLSNNLQNSFDQFAAQMFLIVFERIKNVWDMITPDSLGYGLACLGTLMINNFSVLREYINNMFDIISQCVLRTIETISDEDKNDFGIYFRGLIKAETGFLTAVKECNIERDEEVLNAYVELKKKISSYYILKMQKFIDPDFWVPDFIDLLFRMYDFAVIYRFPKYNVQFHLKIVAFVKEYFRENERNISEIQRISMLFDSFASL